MKSIILLLKYAKFGKIFTTAGSMLLSVVTYATTFGWRYSLGFVGLIFAHEMGHYCAAKKRGLEVGAPIFIPFVGAWIELKALPKNAEVEAYVASAGPLIGTLVSLVVYYLGRWYASDLLIAISYSGFFLNLVNLIPLAPLDGGRITSAISPKLWLLGIPLLVAAFIYRPSPFFILVAVLALPHLKSAINPKTENNNYYITSAEVKLNYGLLYIGLIIFLIMFVDKVYQQL